MALELNKTFDGERDAWIIKPVGDIDIYSAPTFKQELIDMIDQEQKDIVIDGTQLEYIDSTGLGVLISGLKKIKESNKDIYLENIKPNINKLFDITGLNKVFIIQ